MSGLTTRSSPSRVLRDRPGQPAVWYWRDTSLGLAVQRSRGVCRPRRSRVGRQAPVNGECPSKLLHYLAWGRMG
jgi:hypothetical protein